MKKLQESTISDNIVLKVLANIGLGNHGILAVETCMFILYSVLVENSKGMNTFCPGISQKQGERQRGLSSTKPAAFSPISLELLSLLRLNLITNSKLDVHVDWGGDTLKPKSSWVDMQSCHKNGVTLPISHQVPKKIQPYPVQPSKVNKHSSLNINIECLVLQDGCKTVARVSQATEEELMDCSLDHDTAQKIINFFEKDCIQI